MASTNDNQQVQLPLSPSLQGLPVDALSTILSHCTDFQSLLSLGNSSARMQETIYQQSYGCKNCRGNIFISPHLETPQYSKPFICAVCHGKLCGNWADYDKRKCKAQKCDGCGKVECSACQGKHMVNQDGYGTENYCQDCQETFEFGMGGC